MDLERAHIFRLLETADNFIKYARSGTEARASERARERYERALKLAERRGDATLIDQVRLRIEDLGRRGAEGSDGLATGEDPLDALPQQPDGAPAAAAPLPETGGTPSPGAPRSESVPLLVAPAPIGDGRRVPPGQRVTRGWPVLHEGFIPLFDRSSWRLRFDGACKHSYEMTYDELQALPHADLRSDFHCVTGWSKLDNVWRGVQTKVLLDEAEPSPDASHVSVQDDQGYSANLPLEILRADDALVTWSHNGQDLAPEHGYPLRLLVPRLYGWKSVKWVRRFELLTADRRGFWETRGYHNRADPWLEERYSYQEV